MRTCYSYNNSILKRAIFQVHMKKKLYIKGNVRYAMHHWNYIIRALGPKYTVTAHTLDYNTLSNVSVSMSVDYIYI